MNPSYHTNASKSTGSGRGSKARCELGAIRLSDCCGVAKESWDSTSTCHGCLVRQGHYPYCPFGYATTIKRSLVSFSLCVFRLGLPMVRSNDCPFCIEWHLATKDFHTHGYACEDPPGTEAGQSGIGTWEWTCRKFPFQPFKAKQKEWALPLSNGLPMVVKSVSQLQ